MTKKQVHLWIALSVIVFVLVACENDNYAEQREAYARHADTTEPILIGIAWPISADRDLFTEGVQFAVDEINAQGGLLGGRLIEILAKDDQESVQEGRLIAQEFAENPKVVAVLGHFWSFVSIPAAPLYEFNGVLMLCPASTSPELTKTEYNFVYRSITNDGEVGRQLAVYAKNQGYERMAILHVDDSYGRLFANAFENAADQLGIRIIDRRHYLSSERTFSTILDNWEEQTFDAMLVIGGKEAANFIRLARERDIDVPIIAGDGLDTDELVQVAGDAAEGVVVVSHYHPDNPHTANHPFNDKFAEVYGVAPDAWAAQGYDAVYLLAYAIQTAGSSVPADIAHALSQTVGWQGVTGPHTFDEKGDVIGKSVVLKVVRDGQFEFLQLALGE